MSKNFRKRRDKRWKKKAKKGDIAIALVSSSGGESEHYISQSIYRSGAFKPIRRKVTKREIKSGHFGLKKLTRGRVLVTNYKTGAKQVVSKNFKGGITFINTT